MLMSALEKLHVNREAKSLQNVKRVDTALASVDRSGLRDALELGCATGIVSAHLCADYRMRVTGIDLDPRQVARASARFAGTADLRFQTGDATALPFDDAAFDLVIAQNVLHHIPGWRAALEQVARVLRPGGVLLWQDFALHPWLSRVLAPLSARAGVYTLTDVRGTLARGGVHQRRHQQRGAGLVERHQLLLQKVAGWPAAPALRTL